MTRAVAAVSSSTSAGVLLQRGHQRIPGARVTVALDGRAASFIRMRERLHARVLVGEPPQQRRQILDVLHHHMDHAGGAL